MLYIFSSTDKLLTVLSEETGLIETHFKDYQNLIQDETFTFSVHQSKKYSQSYDTFYNLTQVAGSFIGTIDKVESTVNVSPIEFVEEENQVAFYDKDNELRLMRMKELIETTEDGQSIIKVICEPAYLELYDHFIEDKRIVEGTAQLALNRALEGSRYIGEVTLDLGNATDNFYWIDGVEAVFSILDTWGGALKDTITLDDNNNIIERKLWINARLGADNGLIVEPDYNAESIERKTLSYIETALWGQGSSLEIEDEHGELTGGHTRYITFEDVEWKVSKGDPVDKPKGQKWVGDEDARLEHGYIHNGVRKHRFGHFSNQDYETPEELLMATWQALQERKLKEVVHEASIYEDEKGASLGDTVTILNREYSKPIELQSQITGLEYDLLYPKELDIIIGKYIDMSEDPLQKEVDDLKVQAKKPPKPITDISFPDIVPGTPVNFTATGAFQTIQLFWDYDSRVYISHYEVYGSQISDFVPDEQHLLYRGRVSAFSHEVETDEMWYYYVRAVNTRGTAGEFSHRVDGSTVRIITDDILFGSITADLLENNLELANKLSDGTLDWINENPLFQINESENRILTDVGNRIGDVLNDISGINTNVDDLLDRTADVEGSVTNITQIVDDVEGIMETTIQQLTNLDGTVSDHSSTLTHHNDLINARVTKEEFNNGTGEVLNQIAEVDLKADGINASVSQVRADFDNLEIGGRNLLKDTSLTHTGKGAWTQLPSIRLDDDFPYVQMNYGWGLIQRIPLLKAGTYTISVMAKEGTNPNSRVRFSMPGNNQITSTMLTDEWQKVSVTFVLNEDVVDWQVYFLNSHSATGNANIKFSHFQLEKGNKATDWSPAPEDVDARFNTAETRISDLTIDLDGIDAIVQNTISDVDTLTGEVNHHSTEISNINQRADNIELSVTNVQGDLNNAWTEIGLIDVKSDNISLSVSEMRTDFDNLEIGGRNLLRLGMKHWSGAVSTATLENGSYMLTNPTNATYAFLRTIDSYVLKPNQSLTFSFWVIDKSGEIRTQFRNDNSPPTSFITKTIEVVDGRYIVSHTNDTEEDISFTVWITLYAANNDGTQFINLKDIKIEKGNKATDWSPAPEDMADKDKLISYINLSTEGIRLHGDKVHITGQTLIDEAVIGTAAIADLAVDRFHLKQGIIDNVHIADATIEHGKIKSLDVDKVTAGQMDLNYLKAGTIDTDKIKIRGGSAVDYISIDGNDIRTHGQFTRTWGGETDTARLRLGLFGGRVRVTNDDTGYNLYMTEKGLSTTMAGASPKSAGTLEFHSQRFNEVSRGVTLHSTYGTVALVSDYSTIVSRSDLTNNIESDRYSIYLRPFRTSRSGTNEFGFHVKDNASWQYTDGWISFGDTSTSTYHSGLRFSKDSGLYTIYATNGNGDIGTGRFDAASVRANLVARGTNGYAMVESGGQFRVTDMKGYNNGSPVYADMQVDRIQARSIRISSAVGQKHFFVGASSGELRVMNNLFEGYRPVRASSFPTGSSEIYKSDIKLYEENALDILRNSVIYDYVKEGVPNRELGFIIEREFPDIIKHDDISINGYSHSSLNTKAIQELDDKLTNVDDRLNEKDLQIQYLRDKIKQLESAI